MDVKRALLERVDDGAKRRDDCVVEHVRHSASPRSPKAGATAFAATGSARTSSIRRGICTSSKSFRRRKPIRRSSSACPASRISVSAKASSSRRTGRTSSPITSGSSPSMQILKALESGEYTIEEIDAMTGPALGRPKSATFRTMDIAGLDVIGHVAAQPSDAGSARPPVARRSRLDRREGRPGILQAQRGRRSSCSIRRPSPTGRSSRFKSPALEAARNIEDPARAGEGSCFSTRGRSGGFLRATLGPTLLHTADVASDIAYSIDDVDRAMRWGFGWELGPFEIWDAIGVREVLDGDAGGV